MSFQIKQKYICSCLCILTNSDSKSFGSVQWAECKGLLSPTSSVWKAECNGIAQVLPVPCGRHSTSLRWIFKKRAIKLVTHVEPHASAVSLLKGAENNAI